jgi:MOSC domain-containing protein YiiM
MHQRSEGASLPRTVGQIASLQAGRVQNLGTAGAPDPLARPWRSAFFKTALSGPVNVGTLGLDGDQQADTKHHGGANQALLMYSADHFPYWRSNFGLDGLEGGGFGENLTVTGFAEPDVCIGDTLRVGTALLQISQPRQPCSNINRRWGRKGITEAVADTGRGGWYLRVLQPGTLRAGDAVELLARPFPELSIALACDAYYRRCNDSAVLEAFIACPLLTDGFRGGLQKRLAQLA